MAERSAIQLECIAGQIQRWLDWHKERRGQSNVATEGDTHIMALPVPMWPTHTQFEAWIDALRTAAAELRTPNAHSEAKDD